jgi:hypothetical protein
MANKIDFGSKVGPMGPVGATVEKDLKPSAPKTSYPSFYAHKEGDSGFEGLPEGDFHFHGHGKVVSRESRVENRDGKATKHHRVEVEVHHITPKDAEGEPGDSGEGLDKELKKITAKKEKGSSKKSEASE